MKTKTLFHFLCLASCLAGLLFIGATLPGAHAQGTAFTYQGRLNASGVPANGSYDLQFTFRSQMAGRLAPGRGQPTTTPFPWHSRPRAAANSFA